MKIYTYVRMDIHTGEVLEERSIDYSGEVALCKGGGSQAVDREYNARMAAISEQQQKMAQEYFNFWKSDYKPLEKAQIKENIKMLPHMTEATIAEANYKAAEYQGMLKKDAQGQSVLGLSLREKKASLQQSLELMPKQTAVSKAAYQAALRGVDENAAASRAGAGVAQSFNNAEIEMRRELGRVGIGASGDQYTAAMAGLARDKAKARAGAMTQARTQAQDEEFSRLAGLMKR